MNHISTKILGLLLCLTAAATALTGCDSLIYDYEGDCDYRVRFVFDRNLNYADAFAHEVNAVTLYIVDDATGRIVWEKSESGPELKTGNYRMRIDRDLPDGTYTLLAWCGEGKDEHFLVADHTHHTHLRCRMEREYDAASARAISRPLASRIAGACSSSASLKQSVQLLALAGSSPVVK
ncbi:MAG: FimB/Mfa2 family fimbrial subunit, partial [Muribaculaceae bacterium]|nr:FimB/Mfa2 family fimbrial subunit [Muribaculaceae bacterium]